MPRGRRTTRVGAGATPVVAVKAAKATATKAAKTKEHNPRQRIVQAAISHNSKELISLANEHCDGTSGMDVCEQLETLSTQQMQQLFSGLRALLEETIQQAALNDTEALAQQQELSEATRSAFNVVHAITIFCKCLLEAELQTAPDDAGACVQHLHGLTFCFPVEFSETRDLVAKTCELWWQLDLPGKEHIVPQTLSYLLMRSMHESMTAASVKRVYAMREALVVLDWDDEDSEPLKGILTQCFITPIFLSTTEGQRFCSYIMCLHLDMIRPIHNTIKSTLPRCPSSRCSDYGEIYFRAWRSATGPYREAIEDCLQDLMDHAVHAARTKQGGVNMANVLRRVIQGFTDKKRERNVDEILTRLYQPILWRALKVANPVVRANAAALLSDAFPLQSDELARAEADQLMQDQFDAFESLLVDPCPLVRATAVEGVCRMANDYWELIPKDTVAALFQHIVQDLSRDGSNVGVRVSVIKGLAFVLDNHLAHGFLRKLLPTLRQLIHDPSSRVREAMVDLLLVTKGIRDIKFYEVVPTEDLLARLELEGERISFKLVALLESSYFPSGGDDATRVQRCLSLMNEHQAAGRAFFYQLCRARGRVADSDLARFAHVLGAYIADSGAEPNDERDPDSVTLQNGDVALLLEVVTIIIKYLHEVHGQGSGTMIKLAGTLSPMLNFVESHFDGMSMEGSLALIISACLPVPCSRMEVVEKIQELEQSDLDGNLVRAYVEWLAARGHGPLLASAAHVWLATALGQPAPPKAPAKGRKKSKKVTAISMVDLNLQLDGSCGPQGLRALAHLLPLAAREEMASIAPVSMEAIAKALESVPDFLTTGANCARSASSLDNDAPALLRMAFETQVFMGEGSGALATVASAALEMASSFAGRTRDTFSEEASLSADSCAEILEQTIASITGLLRLGLASPDVIQQCLALVHALSSEESQVKQCGKVVAMFGSQLAARSHGTDQDENDDHIFAIIKYFCASSVQYPQIAVDLGRHFGAFLLSTAKAFQRRRRLATLTKAVAAYALESVKALEERSPMGLEATAEKEGMAVFFAIGRLGMRNTTLATIFIDKLISIARQEDDEKMQYNVVQVMAFLSNDELSVSAAGIKKLLRERLQGLKASAEPQEAENADPLLDLSQQSNKADPTSVVGAIDRLLSTALAE